MTPEEAEVINAALDAYPEIRERDQRVGPDQGPKHRVLLAAIEALIRERCTADPFVWVERSIIDVRKGDVIRLIGQPGSEIRVCEIKLPAGWHVHPRANQYRPNEMPAEWSEVKVAFNDYPEPGDYFGFPPGTAVEIKVTERELAAINALGGFPNRLGVTEK